uniref:Nucleoporin Nup43 isoform X2 n=1 Tax=Petromyzon marinus TaxID=7757 RepID=A0AAJ7ULB7_PETMA|nr:nucleoporin Nup43 isoform X2 [Petromyzon marinus]
MADVFSRAVAHKVSRARWRPATPGSLAAPAEFATGSWDAQHENKVCLWSLSEEVAGEPRAVCEAKHSGDVMDMQFLDRQSVITASSVGSLAILTIPDDGKTLRAPRCLPVHRGVCTSVSARGQQAASVGEDGLLALVDVAVATVLRRYGARAVPCRGGGVDWADCTSLHAVRHATSSGVLAVNSLGQLKHWDMRRDDLEPTAIMASPGCSLPLLCVCVHPSQPHVVAVGGEDGTLQLWDVRQRQAPTALLQGHTAEMWEVQFHPTAPENLFTCSQDGSLWHWRVNDGFSGPVARPGAVPTAPPGPASPGSVSSAVAAQPARPGRAGGGCGWLGHPSTSGLLIDSLLPPVGAPLNGLDAAGTRLVCGGDTEKVYVCTGIAAH